MITLQLRIVNIHTRLLPKERISMYKNNYAPEKKKYKYFPGILQICSLIILISREPKYHCGTHTESDPVINGVYVSLSHSALFFCGFIKVVCTVPVLFSWNRYTQRQAEPHQSLTK